MWWWRWQLADDYADEQLNVYDDFAYLRSAEAQQFACLADHARGSNVSGTRLSPASESLVAPAHAQSDRIRAITVIVAVDWQSEQPQ
jgi:hypothetical protein